MSEIAPTQQAPKTLAPRALYPLRIKTRYAVPIALVHVLALLALLPWFFSWTGVILALLGLYVFGTLGINIGYHRLVTHHGFVCPRWLECTFALLGASCGEDSPSVWAATHRRHHQYSDEEPDPHSPLVSFFWGHLGWLVIKNDELNSGPLIERYAKDLARDPFYVWLDRSDNWIKVALVTWLLLFLGGVAAATATGEDAAGALQFGLSLLVWGAFVRMVLVWHLTWSVNSVAHLWGYRNYETADASRNNIFVGLLASGEGWHNNHHADPRSARHGHKWWEFDLSWLTIRLLMALGLARDVALPSPAIAQALQARAARQQRSAETAGS